MWGRSQFPRWLPRKNRLETDVLQVPSFCIARMLPSFQVKYTWQAYLGSWSITMLRSDLFLSLFPSRQNWLVLLRAAIWKRHLPLLVPWSPTAFMSFHLPWMMLAKMMLFFSDQHQEDPLFLPKWVSDALPCPSCIIWRQSCKISPGKLFKMKISFGGGLHVTILALLILFLGLEHYSSFLWVPRQAFTITFLAEGP